MNNINEAKISTHVERNIIVSIFISKSNKYHAIIIAVGHKQFANYKRIDLEPYMENKGIIFDIKSLLPEEEVDGRI